MTDAERKIEAAFRAGFQAGFAISREGFNGECEYDHCADWGLLKDHEGPPKQRGEDIAWTKYVNTQPFIVKTGDCIADVVGIYPPQELTQCVGVMHLFIGDGPTCQCGAMQGRW